MRIHVTANEVTYYGIPACRCREQERGRASTHFRAKRQADHSDRRRHAPAAAGGDMGGMGGMY